MQVTVSISECAHLHGGTILRHDFPDEYSDLVEVLTTIQLPLRSADDFTTDTRPLRPKRQQRKFNGKKLPALMPVDLPELNKALDKALSGKGWTSQPVVASQGFDTEASALGLKGDFVKNKVFVEVEFGNIASFFRDLFKFQIANRAGVGDVAVLVTAMDRMARFHDQGVTTFETVERLLPYMAIGIQMPIWVVGLEPADWTPIKIRYKEMQSICFDNDVECHAFDIVFGQEVVVQVEGESHP